MEEDFYCGDFHIVRHYNTVWYDNVEEVWRINMFDSLDETELDMAISYCPFCGRELEKPLIEQGRT